MNLSRLSLANLKSLIQRSGGYLLVVLFNIGDHKSRKTTLPLSRELSQKLPDLHIVGVHVQEGEKDFLPGQIMSVVRNNEIPYEIYVEGERERKRRWSIIPQWILFDRNGDEIRTFHVENEPDLQRVEDYLKGLTGSGEKEV